MARSNALTDTHLRNAKWTGADQWLNDGGPRGAGRLVARVRAAGISFHFQYFSTDRKRRLITLGDYDRTGKRGLTLATARDLAAEQSRLYRSGETELHEKIEHEQEQVKVARRDARDAAERTQREAAAFSVRQLLDAYQGYLERGGKESARSVRNIFKAHVYTPWPELAAKRATDATIDDFVALLARLTDQGKGRTAAKLRSYLRAAYALAIDAKTNPDAPLAMRTFKIVTNPLASVASLSKYNLARNRVLSAQELRYYIRRVGELPEGATRDLLTLAVVLGGQRIVQLARARAVDADIDAGTITLYDPKGRRKEPRVHMLPLTERAQMIVAARFSVASAVGDRASIPRTPVSSNPKVEF